MKKGCANDASRIVCAKVAVILADRSNCTNPLQTNLISEVNSRVGTGWSEGISTIAV